MKNKPKFLVDACVGPPIQKLLQTQNLDSKNVDDIKIGLKDKEIIKIALKEKRVIVTMDRDFGELVFKEKYDHYGVLYLRLDDDSLKEKTRVMSWILENYIEQLAGKFSVFQNGRLRIG